MTDWFVHDLPEDEKTEIISCIGRKAIVTDIDAHGFFCGVSDVRKEKSGEKFLEHFFAF
ncbi:hypothetical protein [Undibacterium sp. KW1]|uniref:hypothetical protein n=1 Tax=Undibacterium sp. KW1 TaxID=2058624 RepID=UPI001389B79A|nr:hypothetical protein [Undibacterium sp. KW1]